MGVTGLLPLLKDIQETKSLNEYRGKTLAVDAYAWLHRSVYSCTYELSNDLSTFKYLNFFKKRIGLFKNFGIELYFVFDGDEFNSKKITEIKRKEARENNKLIGLEMLKDGANHKKAMDFLKKSIDVTPEIAKTVIDYLIAENIKFVVSPYESDSQLVYLEKLKLVDGIISEDSDLLVFGCQKLLTKFSDKDNTLIEIHRANFPKLKNLPMINTFTMAQFTIVACLSGCDYTKGIPKIGLKKSFQIVRHYPTFDKAIMKLKLDGFQIPKTFIAEYERAYLSFTYPRVFNPLTLEIDTLNQLPEELSVDPDMLDECIGRLLSIETHRKVANGEINPFTKEKLISRETLLLSSKGCLHPQKLHNQNNSSKMVQRSNTVPLLHKPINTLDTFKNFIKKNGNSLLDDKSGDSNSNADKSDKPPSICMKVKKFDRSISASSVLQPKTNFTDFKEKLQNNKKGLKIFRDNKINIVNKKLNMFNDVMNINNSHHEKELAVLKKKKDTSKYFSNKENLNSKITIINLDIVGEESSEIENPILKKNNINILDKRMASISVNNAANEIKTKELKKISLLSKYSFIPGNASNRCKEILPPEEDSKSFSNFSSIKRNNEKVVPLKKRKLTGIVKIQKVSKYLSQSERIVIDECARSKPEVSLDNLFAYQGEN